MFRIPNINQCVKNFLRVRKVEFIKWINLMNVLFIGFVKHWFSAYQDQFCVWFSLARQRTAGRIFSVTVCKKENTLPFLFSC